MKKILILNGSPRLNGNTFSLIEKFTKGAKLNGNDVIRFDLDRMDIHCCKGCLKGGKNPDSPCSQKDDMLKIYPYYKEADILVLASPMYYWSFSAQLKIAIDRLFAVTEIDPNYKTPYKECFMLMAAEGDDENNSKPVIEYYHYLLNYLGWKDLGYLIAGGVFNVEDIKGKEELLNKAFEIGKSIL